MSEMWINGKNTKVGSEREPDVIEKIAIQKEQELQERVEALKAENAAELAAAREEARDKARFDRMVKDGLSVNSRYDRSILTGKPFQTKTGSHLW